MKLNIKHGWGGSPSTSTGRFFFKSSQAKNLAIRWGSMMDTILGLYEGWAEIYVSLVGLQLLIVVVLVATFFWGVERKRFPQVNQHNNLRKTKLFLTPNANNMRASRAALEAEIAQALDMVRATHSQLSELHAAARRRSDCAECATSARRDTERRRKQTVDRYMRWIQHTHETKYAGEQQNRQQQGEMLDIDALLAAAVAGKNEEETLSEQGMLDATSSDLAGQFASKMSGDSMQSRIPISNG